MVKRALGGNIGREKGSAALVEVERVSDGPDLSIYHHLAPAIVDHSTTLRMPEFSPSDARVRLVTMTPLRLQRDGRPLSPKEISARPLLMALIRRIGLITEFHTHEDIGTDYSALGELAETVTIETKLEWLNWERYSNRQKQKMSFGGVVGKIELGGSLGPFLPYLHLGQWLHLGKNATFGLGQYQIS